MRVRLRSAREERAVAERKAAEIREAKALAKTKEAEALEKEAEAQKAEMHAKFASLAAARRAEIAAGDAKRAGLEAERAVLKRKEMKALWEKQKAREAKYAEMMSAENDAGTALVEETRAHRRSADEARKADRERRAAAKKEERKANREKARAYQETVAQMEARQKEKQATIKKELRMRAAALEAEAKKRREASEEARRAERRARGEVTPRRRRRSGGRAEAARARLPEAARRRGRTPSGTRTPRPPRTRLSLLRVRSDERRSERRRESVSDFRRYYYAYVRRRFEKRIGPGIVFVRVVVVVSKNVFTKTLEKTSRQNADYSAASLRMTRRARAPRSSPLRRRRLGFAAATAGLCAWASPARTPCRARRARHPRAAADRGRRRAQLLRRRSERGNEPLRRLGSVERDDGAETTSVVCAKLSASSSSSRIANVSPRAAPSAAARLKALSDGSDEPVSLDDARNVRSSSAAAMPSSVPAFPGPRARPATTLLTAPSAASSDASRAGVDGADAVANARDTASEALESARSSSAAVTKEAGPLRSVLAGASVREAGDDDAERRETRAGSPARSRLVLSARFSAGTSTAASRRAVTLRFRACRLRPPPRFSKRSRVRWRAAG